MLLCKRQTEITFLSVYINDLQAALNYIFCNAIRHANMSDFLLLIHCKETVGGLCLREISDLQLYDFKANQSHSCG